MQILHDGGDLILVRSNIRHQKDLDLTIGLLDDELRNNAVLILENNLHDSSVPAIVKSEAVIIVIHLHQCHILAQGKNNSTRGNVLLCDARKTSLFSMTSSIMSEIPIRLLLILWNHLVQFLA